MGTKGQPFRKEFSTSEIENRERNVQTLRSLVNDAGGITSYARKIGVSKSNITAMLGGYARVTDRALGKHGS